MFSLLWLHLFLISLTVLLHMLESMSQSVCSEPCGWRVIQEQMGTDLPLSLKAHLLLVNFTCCETLSLSHQSWFNLPEAETKLIKYNF